MKAKSLLYAAVAAMACLSCSREAEESGVLDTGIELAFTAEWVNENGTDSRTVLQDDGTNIWWMPGDEINIFFGDKASGRFRSDNSEPEAVVDFQGTLPVAIGSIETEMSDLAYWAVYPYSASNSCDGQSVTLSVSSSQTAKAGGFANKTFPAIAKSRSFGLAFYNVCGGVRFSLTQEGVKEVVFQGQDDEDIAGKMKVAFVEGVPAVQEITEGEKTITLTAPGNGSFETGKWYYITIIPGTLSEGFKMTFNTDTQYATLKASNAKTVKRGVFGSLADADEDLIYKDRGDEPEPDPEDAISFADPIAKYACVEKFDTNGDGEVSYAEAAAATSLSGLFTDWNTVTLFDEIRFFTSVSSTQNVFTGLKNLKHITISDNITTLGTFQNCTALDTVALPAALKALPASCFEGCSALESVKLPEEITAIPNNAFRNCSSLETLAIPSTITSIGQNAFTGCTILAGIDLPYGLKTIGNYAFERCGAITSVSIGGGVSIDTYAFSDCASLTTVVLPEDMTSIPEGCFQNCTVLANITWPAALTDIGAYAFYGCFISEDNSEASTIELPATVKSIGSQAFVGIRHLILPSTSAISIASDSFATGYTHLYVPSWMVEMYKVRTNWSAYKNQIYPISDYPVASVYAVPEAVDLGLSVKWASFNLGATKPEEYGDYFAWGETEPYYIMKNPLIWKNGKSSRYSWSTYKWCMNGSYSQLTKYCNNASYGYNGFTDNKTVLDPEDDAAAAALGGSWRMPTVSECQELVNTCTWTWTTQNGVNGRLVTGPNGNSIFLPAASYWGGTSLYDAGSCGYYWSSSLYTDGPGYAGCEYFGSSLVDWGYAYRYRGHSVRPVLSNPASVSWVKLDKTALSLYEGASAVLVATVLPETATNKQLTWSSSNPEVASVNASGTVQALKTGEAIITVTTADGGRTAGCTVTVNAYEPETPELVDLGLSVKWASFNLGALAPEEYGDYFAWGETEPKEDYDWSTYKWCKGSYSTLTKYCNKSGYGYNGFTDNKTVLDPEDDAAAVALGGSWRMATIDEWKELYNNCTWTWTPKNGVNGRLFTGPNGNSIFLPAAGYRGGTSLYDAGSYGDYWSSSLYTDSPYSYYVGFNSSHVSWYYFSRVDGRSVRPVSE